MLTQYKKHAAEEQGTQKLRVLCASALKAFIYQQAVHAEDKNALSN
jgi:hypothetical protein